MSTKKQLESIKRIVIPILKKNGVVKAGIFGSYARGEERKKSDLDFLIKFGGRKSLLDLVGLKLELENKLKKEVNLTEYAIIHPLLKERILKEEVRVL